ncbi:hypothetical protein, partial [Winogradskyella sp.]|uniref:hypothetical protein n=1 Tax=Winogradskyella sp. TaxID=1883156 RepID=UPI0025E315DD
MKNLATILVFVFAFTFTAEAQQRRKQQRQNYTIEQQTEMAVKKMTLALNLSDKQVNQLTPIMKAQVASKKAMMEKRKANRANSQKPTIEEKYKMQISQLDQQIDFQRSMQDILDKEQFKKYEKMTMARKMKGKKMLQKKGQMQK